MARTIGIVGGLGPEGTIHYYRKLTGQLATIPLEHGRPGVIIDHLWVDRIASLLRAGADAEIAALLADSVRRLHRAGADTALIAAVTPHKYLGAVRESSPIPLVDLVDATEREVKAAGYRVVGLLGTRPTLTEPFFKGALERSGVKVTVPGEDGIAYLHELIFGPLASGAVTEAMKREVRGIARDMASAARLDAIIVGCTDLMDLMDSSAPLIDPIDCHIRQATAWARATPSQ
jgi:aspartate racemase